MIDRGETPEARAAWQRLATALVAVIRKDPDLVRRALQEAGQDIDPPAGAPPAPGTN